MQFLEVVLVEAVAHAETPRRAGLAEEPSIVDDFEAVRAAAHRVGGVHVPRTVVVDAQLLEQRGAAADGNRGEVDGVFGDVVVACDAERLKDGDFLHARDGVALRRHLDFQVVTEAIGQQALLVLRRRAVERAGKLVVRLLVAVAVEVVSVDAPLWVAEVGAVGEADLGGEDVPYGADGPSAEVLHAVDLGGEPAGHVEIHEVVEAEDGVGLQVPCRVGGFRYGENTERINKKTGESTIIQKAVDFYGNKERVN